MKNTSKDSITQQIINVFDKNSQKLASSWNESDFTKFLIIDNFLTPDQAKYIYNKLPNSGEKMRSTSFFLKSKKMSSIKLDNFDLSINNFFLSLQDNNILNKISDVTNIKNLEADKSLYAGGLTMMLKNYFLNPHIDNSHNFKRNAYRRLNLLFYLNPDWRYEDGGNLEIWDNNVMQSETILSKFNRLVIMETNNKSWHSVSKVLSDNPRYCLSVYLYTKDSPLEKHYYHVTSFTGTPEMKILRIYSVFDNFLRQKFSKIFKIGRI